VTDGQTEKQTTTDGRQLVPIVRQLLKYGRLINWNNKTMSSQFSLVRSLLYSLLNMTSSQGV